MARRGPVTSEQVAANAQRTYRKFSPQAVMRSLGIGVKTEYFYTYGFTPEGRCVIWGPLPPEEADAAARGLLEGEVFELETRDLHKATQAIKAEMLHRGENVDATLGRVSHKRLETDE